jgi:ubiquinone/menaquinone biosynthesis C-methylase UbiE
MDGTKRDEFLERLFVASNGFFDLLGISLGDRLGLYEVLRETPRTAQELAAETGINERYAREWLEHQTVGGILETDDPEAGTDERRYSLSEEHAEVLLDRDSLNYVGPSARGMMAIARQSLALEEAFRTGGGVSWEEFGDDMRLAQERINRPTFLNLLGQDWMTRVPDVDEKLKTADAPRIAEIGSGGGWAAIAFAQAYPNATVNGFDLDEPSVARATENAKQEGLDDRVSFETRDAGDPKLAGSYDLVTAFECIHDMSRPVDVLSSMRRLAAEGGTVLVVDENAAESFGAIGDPMEQILYGYSFSCCLPDGMSSKPSAGTGTVMRPATFKSYAKDAGFANVDVIDLDHSQFRMYRLTP